MVLRDVGGRAWSGVVRSRLNRNKDSGWRLLNEVAKFRLSQREGNLYSGVAGASYIQEVSCATWSQVGGWLSICISIPTNSLMVTSDVAPSDVSS